MAPGLPTRKHVPSQSVVSLSTSKVPLLELPGEIRNKIYDLIFTETHVRLCRGHGWKDQQDQKRGRRLGSCGNHAPSPATRNHRFSCLPQQTGHHPTPLGTMKNRAALLGSCHQIRAEAMDFIYARATFNFESPKLIDMFLNVAPAQGVRSIRKIELVHSTGGEPQLTAMREWKIRHDLKWQSTCERIAMEMTGLEELKLRLRICDWPTELNQAACWAQPILVLRGAKGLARVQIILAHASFSDRRLCGAARALERAMLSDEAREEHQHQEDLARIAAMEWKQKEQHSKRKPIKATKILSVTLNKVPIHDSQERGNGVLKT